MTQFDHTRIDRAEPLCREDARSAMSPTYLVMDYMEHLETVSVDMTPEQDERERKSALKFIHLIDNDNSWPIAKQYMSQNVLDTTMNDKIKNQYLVSIMDAVAHRLPKPTAPCRKDEVQKLEANMLWQTMRHQINFIASFGQPMDAQREQEVKETLTTLRGIFPLAHLLDDTEESIDPVAPTPGLLASGQHQEAERSGEEGEKQSRGTMVEK